MTSRDLNKIFILPLKPSVVSYFDNQGQFWKPQNLRKRVKINLIGVLLFQWVKIEIQKCKVVEMSVLRVVLDTFFPNLVQKKFKMAFRLTNLKLTCKYSSKTPLDCLFLIIRKQLRDV